MTRKLALLLAIVGWMAVSAMANNAQDDQTAEEAFKEGREAFEEAETAEEKLALITDFLNRFPNSDYTDQVLGLGVELLTDHFKDPDRAEKLLHNVAERAEDANVKRQVLLRLAGFYTDTGNTDQFTALADDLANNHALKYADLYDLGEKAIKNEAWDLTLRLSEKAIPLATAEQFRSDYPDMKMTEEELARRGRRRKSLTLSHEGWAQVQLGKIEEGVETLRNANELSTTDYVGIPSTDARKYLGMALLRQSKYDQAIELLAADAVYAGKEDALQALKKAYIGRTGGDEGFASFSWKSRVDRARKIEPFVLKNYQDNAFDFNSLEGDVVLLAFWFPT